MSNNQSLEELIKIFSDHFRSPTYVKESVVKAESDASLVGSIKTTFSFLEIEILYSEQGSLGIIRVVGSNLNLYSTPNKVDQKFGDTCGLLRYWLEETTSELQLLLFKAEEKKEFEEVRSTYKVTVAQFGPKVFVTLIDDSPGLLYNALQKPLDQLTQEEMQQFYISLEEGVRAEIIDITDEEDEAGLYKNIDIVSVSKIS